MTGQAKARGTYEQRKALAVVRNAEIAERDAEARAIRMAERAASSEGRRRAERHQGKAFRAAMIVAALDHGGSIPYYTTEEMARGRRR